MMNDKIQDILGDCDKIIAEGGDHITLVLNKGCSSRGLGFGRGELVCEGYDGRRVFRYDVNKVKNALSTSKN